MNWGTNSAPANFNLANSDRSSLIPDDVEAIFVMGHGTKSVDGRSQFLEAVECLRASIKQPVFSGFIELCEPNMYPAMDELLATNPESIVVAPLILLPAGHLKDDGAELVNYVRTKSPQVDVAYSRDLGAHRSILDTITARIQAANDGPDAAVLLVGRGSSDPDANSELFKISRLIKEFGGFIEVETSFISLALPSVIEGLDRLYALGRRDIVVQPYFLYRGALLDRIYAQANQWVTNHPDCTISLGKEIGIDDSVTQVLIERIAQASRVPILMSCDICIYRHPISFRGGN